MQILVHYFQQLLSKLQPRPDGEPGLDDRQSLIRQRLRDYTVS